jgi:acyl-CoA reductase-like NAD-dependent aldehyde dehydrogenase
MTAALPELKVTPFIDGVFAPRENNNSDPIIDPWTGKTIAQVTSASEGRVESAISAARRAFVEGPWPRVPVFERGQVLRAIAEGIVSRSEDLAIVEAMNAGKPLADARREVQGAARVFTYYAGAMDKYFGETIPISDTLLDFTLREPLGVVAQITPWNFPLLAASWKLAPALAAGCTCILKPSPLTPLSTLLLAEITAGCGVPNGVINIVPGGSATGRLLAEHDAVDGISFTGSTAVGSEVMRYAAGTIKKLALELGGKNASVIFADADMEKAATIAVKSAFGNAGQSCSARSRLLVEHRAVTAFTDALVDLSARLRPGDVFDPLTTMGPLISAEHWKRVDRSVHAARHAGATLIAGGARPDRFKEGNFYLPTILTNVDPEMPAFQDEIFGPVCTITPFSGEDEAVRLANLSSFGLNGSVWSRDIGRALRVARKVRTGMIAVNGLPSASTASVFAPFGGYKRSGLGRELGMHALSFYTEVKNVFVDLS